MFEVKTENKTGKSLILLLSLDGEFKDKKGGKYNRRLRESWGGIGRDKALSLFCTRASTKVWFSQRKVLICLVLRLEMHKWLCYFILFLGKISKEPDNQSIVFKLTFLAPLSKILLTLPKCFLICITKAKDDESCPHKIHRVCSLSLHVAVAWVISRIQFTNHVWFLHMVSIEILAWVILKSFVHKLNYVGLTLEYSFTEIFLKRRNLLFLNIQRCECYFPWFSYQTNIC